MGPTRTLAKVTDKLCHEDGRTQSYFRLVQKWSVDWEWVRRCLKFDEDIDRKNREAAAVHIPYWQKQRQRSHRLNMKLARDIRAKLRQMLDHPITVEEVKEWGGREVVFNVPAKWTYATVGNLAKIAAELEAGTIADAMMLDAELESFDVQSATIEQLREFIERQAAKRKGIIP
jgi:hypothetical protein